MKNKMACDRFAEIVLVVALDGEVVETFNEVNHNHGAVSSVRVLI